MRLIDADALRANIEKDRESSDMPKMWHEGIEYAVNHIIHEQTVDAVEVIRCKDCKYYEQDKESDWCHAWGNDTSEDNYCSHAERRQDG